MPRTLRPFPTIHHWWKEHRSQHGSIPTLRRALAIIWDFLRESTPSRRKQRYGDTDYDWDHRVDTTAATLHWTSRLLGYFHSPYQPTEPALFREMLAKLDIDFRQFIFIDIGSGKGRALLMAADYPFRRVLGVELLPELHRIAQENLAHYTAGSQQCFVLESTCEDAQDFVFPSGPLVVYLFNPLPEPGLIQLVANLEQSIKKNSRPVYLLYHNPLLEHVLTQSSALKKLYGTHQFSIYRERG